METKAILATFYIILGIYSMIVYLGKFNTLPRTITRTEIDEITKKLEPYSVTILY